MDTLKLPARGISPRPDRLRSCPRILFRLEWRRAGWAWWLAAVVLLDNDFPGWAADGVEGVPPRAIAATKPPLRLGLVEIDARRRVVSLPARVLMTNGVVEYALVTDYGKTHESLLMTEAKPTDLQAALLLLNARPAGTNAILSSTPPPAGESGLEIRVSWRHQNVASSRRLEELVRLTAGLGGVVTGALAPGPWLFNGSTFSPEGFVATFEGSLIALIRDVGAIVNSPRSDWDDDDIHVPAIAEMPAVGTPVTVEIEVRSKSSRGDSLPGP